MSVHYLTRSLASTTTLNDPFAWPGSEEGWQERYQYLLDAFHGENYTPEMIKALQLFRALDENGKEIASARRLYRDRQFLIEVATSALAIGQVVLQATPEAPEAEVAMARDIWTRSEMETQGDLIAQQAAIFGDVFLEPYRMRSKPPYGVEIASHDARTVHVEYDPTRGRRIDSAVITHEIASEATVDGYGNVIESGATTRYQRRLDPTNLALEVTNFSTTSKQRELTEATTEPAPHGLGATPLAHGRFTTSPEQPEHSLPVTHGLDRAEAEVNSLASQISAIGDRYGNPKLLIKGVKVSAGSDISLFGRIINIFGGSKEMLAASDAKYLEPSLAGVGEIREQMVQLITDVRLTYPEFLFSGSTANLSGDALKMLATRYEVKYEAIRRRIYGALEKALAMGVAMEMNRPYDPLAHPVVLQGPPLMPADVKARLDELKTASDIGGISRLDIVRGVQALGLADPDTDPEEYLAALDEDAAARAPAMEPGPVIEDSSQVEDPEEESAAP